ncbi:YraN family protein [Colwellia sp. 12G3]|uniref:YraN family protein n=1 Tax=Colwellia sp. 12G3 TaxID=2058299 RepID=UPI000C34605C|nr:YraN family protein [Colwellia sp. 12G3]PKI13045.1 YraN family protein [Colwellia sp. 12G3]
MLWNNNATDKSTTSTDKGHITERYAEQYLTEQGLTLVDRNFHSRQGEIDIIMLDGNTYVFVEVKYRKNISFGGAIAAIPASKQHKIRHSITFYLHKAGLNEYNTACRIDVVALEGDITQPQVTWLKNAF